MNPSQPKFQSSHRAILILAIVAVFLLGGCLLWRHATHQFFHAIFVGETGPVTSRDKWPKPLKELLAEPNGIEIDGSAIQVHCLCNGIDQEFAWRMDAAPSLFDQIEKQWELTKVNNPRWYVLKGYQSHNSGVPTPPWWTVSDDGNTSFYVCPQTLEGEKGDRFKVALDKNRNVIWVHYWFNF